LLPRKTRKDYDPRLVERRNGVKVSQRARGEAERARFEAQIQGKKPQIRIHYGFSDIDPLTNEKWFWDLWLKMPFKLRKEDPKVKLFKEGIQNLFKDTFLV